MNGLVHSQPFSLHSLPSAGILGMSSYAPIRIFSFRETWGPTVLQTHEPQGIAFHDTKGSVSSLKIYF